MVAINLFARAVVQACNRRLMPPLSDLAFHVLLALGDGPSHGYAIGKDIEDRSGGRLDPS